MRRQKINPDENCSMGVGALIMLIAMILMASIVMVSIIQVVEKISQNTDQAGEDARRNAVNTIFITGAWVYDDYDDMLFLMEFGAAGESVARVDVIYVLTCTESDGTFNYRSAALGDSQGGSNIFVWEAGTASPDPDNGGAFVNVNTFTPGGRYFFTLDGGTQASPGGAGGECGPIHLDLEKIDANLFIHLPNGMSTHQKLSLSNGREVGSAII
ncbi:MAG TPA: hypothetical protein EYQ73_00275 [Candidatus Poseidoniales archaeon]|jgi:archaellin|nr:MAG: hypothetical protein CXT71_04650 [Euryarchaeota archaeon]HIF45226.1 hypothetical protein [Candidatus Poseidoniales archaeon]HIL64852.1 hypothetical protein [Candidatus Poseidoniales archaeon]